MKKVNVKEKFEKFSDHWSPKIIGRLNGQLVKAAKLKGEFVWHKHDEEDEMFLVVSGEMKMEFRDRMENLKEGEFIIVPKGVEHKPSAEKECQVLLFEPENTLNTGDQQNDMTKDVLEEL